MILLYSKSIERNKRSWSKKLECMYGVVMNDDYNKFQQKNDREIKVASRWWQFPRHEYQRQKWKQMFCIRINPTMQKEEIEWKKGSAQMLSGIEIPKEINLDLMQCTLTGELNAK
jgi:hypothetical protein